MIATPVDKVADTPHRSYSMTNPNGMRVWEVIKWLKSFPEDAKVCMYADNGKMYQVSRVMRDGRKVVIF